MTHPNGRMTSREKRNRRDANVRQREELEARLNAQRLAVETFLVEVTAAIERLGRKMRVAG